MKWRRRLRLTLGEEYELTNPYLTRNRRKMVVLTSYSVTIDGKITAEFVPAVRGARDDA